MKESDKVKNTIRRFLERDRLKNLKHLAYEGSEIAQIALGNIFFYGINTHGGYVSDIERIIALRDYSEKRKTQYRFPKSKVRIPDNYAVLCECSNPPDYDEALNWYSMAAFSGNKEALEKVKLIKEGGLPEDAEAVKKKHRLCVFRIKND